MRYFGERCLKELKKRLWRVGIAISFSMGSRCNNSSSHHQGQGQHHHHHHHQEKHISFGLIQPSSSSHGNYNIAKETGAYDLGELDQALFMYLEGQDQPSVQEQIQTLNIFPSQPMHVEPSAKVGMNLGPPATTSGSKRAPETSMELGSSRNKNIQHPAAAAAPASLSEDSELPKDMRAVVKKEGNKRGARSSSEHEGPKTPDPKTLRRLAQNREAARKSRLKKKAYVQQLESSRIKLSQLEQDLHRARAQGVLFGSGGTLLGDQGLHAGIGGLPSDAAVFDMEYGRWLEEHHRLMYELRAAVQEHLQENELRVFVDNCLLHYDEVFSLRSMAARSDVFHLVSGMWQTPAERCFLWMGGFRPSELIKIILSHIEPLTEQQILGVCGLQQSMQETEDALSQGLEAIYQSLSDTVASNDFCFPSNMANHMGQMAVAMDKLSTLEGFVRQADNLRQQTLHRLHQILTTYQAARYFLAMAEYFHRLRALSSLWLARPRQD